MVTSLDPAFAQRGYEVLSGDASLGHFLRVSGVGDAIGAFYADSQGVAGRFSHEIEDRGTRSFPGGVVTFDLSNFTVHAAEGTLPATRGSFPGTRERQSSPLNPARRDDQSRQSQG